MLNKRPQVTQLVALSEQLTTRRGGAPLQRKNNTGLPDTVKQGMENLSGVSLDDVKVHYDSSMPATVQAHATTQGSQIHIAPGQEAHVAHEAWHVVQQKQGRVQANTQVGGVPVNDNPSLELEADVMAARARSAGSQGQVAQRMVATPSVGVIQRAADLPEWADLFVRGFNPAGHLFEPELLRIRQVIQTVGVQRVTEYLDEELQNANNEDYNPSNEHEEVGSELTDSLRDPVEGLRQLLLSVNADVDVIHLVMSAFGLPVTKNIIRAVKAYNFDSEWINFTPDNFLCWVNLATGRGTIRDAQYLIHEAIEIGAILESDSGLDPFTTSQEYNQLQEGEQNRLSDVFGGTEDEEGLYDTSHLRALEYEYKFVAIQIYRLTNVALTYKQVAAADPDRAEGRDKLLGDGEETLAEDENYADLGEEVVELSSDARARVGLPAEGPITMSALVRAVKNSVITDVFQLKRDDEDSTSSAVQLKKDDEETTSSTYQLKEDEEGRLPIQREVRWASGNIHYDNDLAKQIVGQGPPYVGATIPLINGHDMTKLSDFRAWYPLPKVNTISQTQDDEDGPVTATMMFDEVPTVDIGYDMHLPTDGPWSITVDKATAAQTIKKFDKSADTSGLAENVEVVVQGSPSDTGFLLHVIDHEFEHVFIAIDHVFDLLWDFDEKLRAAKGKSFVITDYSYDLTSTFWDTAIGGSPWDGLAQFHTALTHAQDQFHRTPKGSYSKPTYQIVAPGKVVFTVTS
ncbi:MAG: DUF4157 domain-containing protein [Polyangiaceae bacterium]|nr:DUF4157 domain-containing protein [Polyangiaceae bacterium]